MNPDDDFDLFASCTAAEIEQINRANHAAAERDRVLADIREQLAELSTEDLQMVQRRLRLRLLTGGRT